MDPERYRRIKEIVIAALELSADDQAGFLDEACGDDEALKQEVRDLLDLDVNQSFLAESPLEVDLGNVDDQTLSGNIGRIKIDRLLARGGMGDVYVGVDQLLKRPVAIKVMTAGLRMSALRRSGFLREARILSRLRHPNICEVYDFFEDRSHDVLVLELIEGRTLREALDKREIRNPLEVAEQITSALAAAHERGIAHRDLKPENIMLTDDGLTKVLDFGLARAEAVTVVSGGEHAAEDGTATQISGTPGYMAPEQARGEPATTASDLWSFGLVLSELLTGRRPFPATLSGQELVQRSLRGEVEVPADLPRAETQLLRSLLNPESGARPTARAVLVALDQIQKRAVRRWAGAAAAGVLVLACIAAWRYTADLQHERTIAIAEQNRAEAARNEAEDLADFMLDELYGGLEEVGRLDLLGSVANKTMDYYQSVDPDRMSQTRGRPAMALVRIAEVADALGRKQETMGALEQATGALEMLRQQLPADDLVRYRLAMARRLQGETLKNIGEYEEGAAFLDMAITLGRELTDGFEPGKGPEERPTGEERWGLLLRGLYLYADIAVRTGAAADAVETLEEAVSLAIPAVGVAPSLGRDLGDIQFKRCDAYLELARTELVVEACANSLALDQALARSNPDDQRLVRNVNVSRTVLGLAYHAAGDLEAALKTFEEGIRLTDQASEWDPDNADVLNDIARNLTAMGKVLIDLDREAEAIPRFQEALVITEVLVRDEEEIFFLHNHVNALTYLGRVEEASGLAKTLTSRGFRRREFVELCQRFPALQCGL